MIYSKNTMIAVLFFIFFNLSHADTQMVYFQACFDTASNAKNAFKEVSFVRNESDKIKREYNCLDFYIDSLRSELYHKFLQIKFMGQYKLKTLADNKEQLQCNLEIIKTQREDIERTKVNSTAPLHLSKRQKDKQLTSSMSMYIADGMSGTMNIDNEQVKIHCRVTKDGYQLKISSNSSEFVLETTRYIKKGSMVDLGDFVQDLDLKNKEVSLKRGIIFHKSIGTKFSTIKIKAN